MTDLPLDALEGLDIAVVLVDDEGLIVFASQCAQHLLHHVNVLDMPINCFISDWHLVRPKVQGPHTVEVEILMVGAGYHLTQAVAFQLCSTGRRLSGIAFPPPSIVG